ncbi:hypothetical protein EMIT0194P_90178 [Pseudomonas serbica]
MKQPFRPLTQAALPVRGQAMGRCQCQQIVDHRPVRQLHLPELVDGKAIVVAFQQLDSVPRFHQARLEYPVIPTGDPLPGDEHRQVLGVKTMVYLPARAARLGDLQHAATDTEHVADVHVEFREPERGNVLPQAPRHQLPGTGHKGLRQPRVVLRRILVHGLFRATVHPGVAVLVADDPLQLHAHGAGAALLEDAGALPFGLQYPQASSEDMVDFRSQCHGFKPRSVTWIRPLY